MGISYFANENNEVYTRIFDSYAVSTETLHEILTDVKPNVCANIIIFSL